MEKDLLTTVKDIAKRLKISAPSTVISNTDRNVIELLNLLEETGREVRDMWAWPEMQKEYTFTLVANQANYALPDDFNYILYDTLWDRSSTWSLIGPLDASQWQERKSGIVSVLPRSRYRIKGFGARQFYIDSTPATGDAGKTFVLEYCHNSWIKSATDWAATTAVTSGNFINASDTVYKVTGNGTTGSTAPTTLVGAFTDGTATLRAWNMDVFTLDTQLIILDQDVLIGGVEWRWKRNNGFEHLELKQDWYGKLDAHKTDLSSASIVNFGRPRDLTPLIGPWSVPDSGYGS